MPMMADEAEMQALQAQSGGPRKALIQFFTDAVQNEEKTLKEGRPIFDDVEFLKKMIPGDATCNFIRVVEESDRKLFPREYAAFKAGQEAPIDGTPLTAIPFISKGQCMELAAQGIRSAEQLRDLSDSLGQKLMGFHGLQRKVIAYLDKAAKDAPAQQVQAELQKRDQEITELRQALAEQARQIQEITKARAK